MRAVGERLKAVKIPSNLVTNKLASLTDSLDSNAQKVDPAIKLIATAIGKLSTQLRTLEANATSLAAAVAGWRQTTSRRSDPTSEVVCSHSACALGRPCIPSSRPLTSFAASLSRDDTVGGLLSRCGVNSRCLDVPIQPRRIRTARRASTASTKIPAPPSASLNQNPTPSLATLIAPFYLGPVHYDPARAVLPDPSCLTQGPVSLRPELRAVSSRSPHTARPLPSAGWARTFLARGNCFQLTPSADGRAGVCAEPRGRARLVLQPFAHLFPTLE